MSHTPSFEQHEKLPSYLCDSLHTVLFDGSGPLTVLCQNQSQGTKCSRRATCFVSFADRSRSVILLCPDPRIFFKAMIQNSQCSYSKLGEKFKIKSKLRKLSKGEFFSKIRKKWHESKDVNFIIIIARSLFYLALITNQNCQIV